MEDFKVAVTQKFQMVDQLGIENDVIRMRLLNSQFINLPIVLEQTYAVTDYCPAELIDYVTMMLAEYGNNPQAEMVKKMRLEVRRIFRDTARLRIDCNSLA